MEGFDVVADSLLRETNLDGPVYDVEFLANLCGFEVEGLPLLKSSAAVCGNRIFYRSSLTAEQRRGHIAHELGHWSLDYYGERQSEAAADAVGASILMPRRDLDSDLKSTWDVVFLMERYQVDAYTVARRICDLRNATAIVADATPPRRTRRYTSGCLTRHDYGKLLEIERHLLDEAIAERRPVRLSESAFATPLNRSSGAQFVVLIDNELAEDGGLVDRAIA